jgi:anaerobic magnesium-protoporphyrin IX monomethyl ester cyclase
MKISISYPPINSAKGVPLLSQNRQFQYFHAPTYIYPVVPAYAATMLGNAGYEVVWDDGIAEEKPYSQWLGDLEKSSPDIIMIETKTPVVKKHWSIINDVKKVRRNSKVVLVGDHVTALPLESMEQSKVDFVLTGIEKTEM